MTQPEEPDALVPPPISAQPGPLPGQSWPGAAPQQPPPTQAQQPSQQQYQYGQPPQQQPQFGQQPGYPPQYQYGYGYGYPSAAPQGGTNGMAIAAMVCGICGFLCLVPGLVGIVLGIVSLPQIKRRQQNGSGMAITGIVVGSLWIVVFILLLILGHHNAQVQVGNSGDSGSGTGV